MQTPCFLLLLLAALAALTTTVHAQRCQMFISIPPDDDPASPKAPEILGEIRQDCAVSRIHPKADELNGPNCKLLGTFEVKFKKEQTISKHTSGLLDDVKVMVFNGRLGEGWLKYKTQDLNFQNKNHCRGETRNGFWSGPLVHKTCEFDCP